jgi:serine/threonine-protein kinase HipA
MTFFCRSTLAPIDADGFTPSARTRLTGSRKRLPHRLSFTRAEVIRYRAEVADRMSISGVQDKVSLRYEKGDLIPTKHDGEFILKPIPDTPLPQHTNQVPANEHLTMQIASQVFGIDTAANALVTLADGEPAYLTQRFDRRGMSKVDMEDFCALAEQSPDTHGRNYKYDGSYERIAQLTRRFCPAHRIENEKLFKQVLFCYAFGNGDAHLKNFSLFTSTDGDPVFTPAYDLINTTLHLPTETPLALDLFADDFETPAFQVLGFHCGSDFLLLAERLGVVASRAKRVLAQHLDAEALQQVDELIGRSFLTSEAQKCYRAVITDRRRALSQRG